MGGRWQEGAAEEYVGGLWLIQAREDPVKARIVLNGEVSILRRNTLRVTTVFASQPWACRQGLQPQTLSSHQSRPSR